MKITTIANVRFTGDESEETPEVTLTRFEYEESEGEFYGVTYSADAYSMQIDETETYANRESAVAKFREFVVDVAYGIDI